MHIFSDRNYETPSFSVMNKSLICTKWAGMRNGKAQVQEVLGHAAKDRNQIRTSSW